MWLATLAPNMPQFGLLAVPVYAIAYLLSGAATPVESMPVPMQALVKLLPTTQFVAMTQAILYRDAGLAVVWPQSGDRDGVGRACFWPWRWRGSAPCWPGRDDLRMIQGKVRSMKRKTLHPEPLSARSAVVIGVAALMVGCTVSDTGSRRPA